MTLGGDAAAHNWVMVAADAAISDTLEAATWMSLVALATACGAPQAEAVADEVLHQYRGRAPITKLLLRDIAAKVRELADQQATAYGWRVW